MFRHSAGHLGSHYLTAIRTQERLCGWQTGSPPRLSVPPTDFGTAGEWIDIGPGAELLSFAPSEWVADSGEAVLQDFVLGRVRIDGAEVPIFALVRLNGADGKRGLRLSVRFAKEQTGTGTNFWFEPVSASASEGIGS